MKLPAISVVVCVLFLLHAACGVESRRSFRSWDYTSIFAFGDSFADVGNTPGKSHDGPVSRAWYYPYGESVTTGRAKATGRFSDDKVQSDFLAKTILGLHEAPPANNRGGFHLYLNGMTFATAGAGVFQVPAANVTTIGQQVDSFERLLKKGTISRSRLRYSVFLVAVSGNDYEPTISDEMAAKVTDEIVVIVNRLRKLGARKILVNNMHPLGCAPRRARYGNNSNYTGCDEHGNAIASVHNSLLGQKLANTNDTVLVLDINTAFTKIINGSYGSDQFTNRLRPCCEATDPKGYCGRGDIAGVLEFNFKLDMDHVNSYFYWDEMNPTNAGWKAVMKQLEGTIKDFLSTDH